MLILQAHQNMNRGERGREGGREGERGGTWPEEDHMPMITPGRIAIQRARGRVHRLSELRKRWDCGGADTFRRKTKAREIQNCGGWWRSSHARELAGGTRSCAGGAETSAAADDRTARRTVLIGCFGVVAFDSLVAERAAASMNRSIVSALQDRSARLKTAPNQIIGKLTACLDEIEIVRDFAAEGEYQIAREKLRKGALGSLRLTIRDASDIVVFERPNFDDYEVRWGSFASTICAPAERDKTPTVSSDMTERSDRDHCVRISRRRPHLSCTRNLRLMHPWSPLTALCALVLMEVGAMPISLQMLCS